MTKSPEFSNLEKSRFPNLYSSDIFEVFLIFFSNSPYHNVSFLDLLTLKCGSAPAEIDRFMKNIEICLIRMKKFKNFDLFIRLLQLENSFFLYAYVFELEALRVPRAVTWLTVYRPRRVGEKCELSRIFEISSFLTCFSNLRINNFDFGSNRNGIDENRYGESI